MKHFFLIFILGLFLAPALVFAVPCNGTPDNGLNLCYPSFGNIALQSNTSLPQLISWAYYLIVGISGFAAFVMLVFGGIQWMASSGDSGKLSDAKDRIEKALLGLLLVLSSYLILQIINPEFTILRSPQLEEPSKIALPPLKDMAQLICANNRGTTPTDAVIRSTLDNAIGAKNYNQNYVDTIRTILLTTCGASSGGTSGGITINQSTVPVSLCTFSNGSAGGVVFGGSVANTSFISFVPGVHSPDQATPLIKNNLSAIINFCGNTNNVNSFCFLSNVDKTRISILDQAQKDLLVQFCTNILPKKP